MERIETMDKTLNVALLQSHLLWENPEANRSMFTEKIAQLSETVDLIVLPEMFTTGFTMSPQHIAEEEGNKTLNWMQEMALKKAAALVGSSVYLEHGNYFNRLFFVQPNGQVDSYDKKHTFTLAGEHEVYTSGNSKLVVDYKNFKICPLICYDLRFPVWARNVEDYDLLLFVANWPKPRIHAWDTLLAARAIENMSYCIGVNRVGLDALGHEYSGHSAAYDSLGHQLVQTKKEESVLVSLSKDHLLSTRKKLRFLEDRDAFNLLS